MNFQSALIGEQKTVKIAWAGRLGKVVSTFSVKPLEKIDKETSSSYITEIVSLRKCVLLKTKEKYCDLLDAPSLLQEEINALIGKKILIAEAVLKNSLGIYVSCPVKI